VPPRQLHALTCACFMSGSARHLSALAGRRAAAMRRRTRAIINPHVDIPQIPSVVPGNARHGVSHDGHLHVIWVWMVPAQPLCVRARRKRAVEDISCGGGKKGRADQGGDSM
jgi:hypothetical protein